MNFHQNTTTISRTYIKISILILLSFPKMIVFQETKKSFVWNKKKSILIVKNEHFICNALHSLLEYVFTYYALKHTILLINKLLYYPSDIFEGYSYLLKITMFLSSNLKSQTNLLSCCLGLNKDTMLQRSITCTPLYVCPCFIRISYLYLVTILFTLPYLHLFLDG